MLLDRRAALMHPVRFEVDRRPTAQRARHRATTARGSYRTPCFMPVGTSGRSSTSAPPTTSALGAEIVLGNTYHLMLRPGAETVARFGGLGRFAGWDGLTLTDSGGFQVFSLDPDVDDDDGVTFTQHLRRLDAPPHARGRPSPRRSCSAPTSRWCSTCARRCRRRPT